MTHFTRRLLTVAALCGMTVAATAQTHNINITTASFPTEVSWELTDGVGPIASAACGTYVSAGLVVIPVTLVNGTTYTFNAFDDYGDTWNGGSWSITEIAGGCQVAGGIPDNLLAGDFTTDCIGQDLEQSVSFDPGAPISGCTNPAASNYNPCATVDDGSCILPAGNDACADAIDIPSGTCYVGSNVGATFGGDTMGTACVDGSVTPADIWFTTTVGASGSLQIDFPVVPGFSSIVELYAGACPASGATGILAASAICNNYAGGGSVVISGLTPGPITIRYYDYGSDDFGSVELCVSEPVTGCTDPCSSNYDSTAVIDDGSCLTPTADIVTDCASAVALAGPGTYTMYSGGAAAEGDVTSCTFGDSIAVYATYNVAVGADSLIISTCGSSYDTGLSLWDGCPSDTTSSEIACNDDGSVGGGFSSTCGGSLFQSAIKLGGVDVDALEGTTVYIRISGFAGQTGCGDLIIDEQVAACSTATPPQNPSHVNNASNATLSWDPVPLSVACQVKGTRLTPPGPSPTVNIIAPEPSSTNVPYAAAGAGTTWEWSVRCACSTSPVLATAFSVKDTFSVPNPKVGVASDLVLELFPNPADNMLMVSYNALGGEVNMSVVDMLGRTVISRTESMFEGANNTSIDVSSLEPAAYFLSIEEAGEVKTVNFTVSR